MTPSDSTNLSHLQQVTRKGTKKLRDYFGDAASDHIERLLPLRLKNDNIILQYIEGGEMTGFIIFDNSIFVRFILATDSDGNKVSIGISIQENQTSNTIKDFCERYSKMIMVSDNYNPQRIKEDML